MVDHLTQLQKKYTSLVRSSSLREDLAKLVLELTKLYKESKLTRAEIEKFAVAAMFDEASLDFGCDLMLQEIDNGFCDLIDVEDLGGDFDKCLSAICRIAEDVLDGYHYAQIGVLRADYLEKTAERVTASASIVIYRGKGGLVMRQAEQRFVNAISPLMKGKTRLYEVVGNLPQTIGRYSLNEASIVSLFPRELDEEIVSY